MGKAGDGGKRGTPKGKAAKAKANAKGGGPRQTKAGASASAKKRPRAEGEAGDGLATGHSGGQGGNRLVSDPSAMAKRKRAKILKELGESVREVLVFQDFNKSLW